LTLAFEAEQNLSA